MNDMPLKVRRGEQSLRPASSQWDRVGYILSFVRGQHILDVGANRAILCHRYMEQNPTAVVVAFDVSTDAATISQYRPYVIGAAEQGLPFLDKAFDMVVCTQCLEYLTAAQGAAVLCEMCRVGRKLLLSVTDGPDSFWYQTTTYTAKSFEAVLRDVGKIEVATIEHGMALFVVDCEG